MPTSGKRAALVCAAALFMAPPAPAAGQDIRGLEHCMAEKQIERRTGCLQANAEFLQQEILKLKRETDSKLAAAGREIVASKAEIAALKATLAKLDRELALMKTKPEPAKK